MAFAPQDLFVYVPVRDSQFLATKPAAEVAAGVNEEASPGHFHFQQVYFVPWTSSNSGT